MKINPMFSLIKEYLSNRIDFNVFSTLLSKDLFSQFDTNHFSLDFLQKLENLCFEFFENLSNKDYSTQLLTRKILDLYIDQIQQIYEAFSSYIMNVIEKSIDGFDDSKKRRILFLTRLFIDAMSPSNCIYSNKDILEDLCKNPDSTALDGLSRYFDDIKKGKSLFDLPITDETAFRVGENIACTPGKVIFQNELMQLIQYTPTTPKTFTNPVLIVPAWINKYYIFDMQQKNSLVKMLIDKGFSVFIISWVNPNKNHKNTLFFDYLNLGPLKAIEKIQEYFGNNPINLVGYCLGGTLSACLLSLLAKKSQDSYIASTTFLTTPLDFSDCHNLKLFSDEEIVKILDKEIKKCGFLRGDLIKNYFNILRSKETIWPAFINHYFKKEESNPFDILYWHSDPVNIAPKVQQFFCKKLLNGNNLVSNKLTFPKGYRLDLSKITKPSYFLAAKKDHIIPWTTCYKSQKYLQGPSRFILTDAGHVVGVINPPNSKYGYWKCDEPTKNFDEFLDKSIFIQDTWWHDWISWLTPYGGKRIKAKTPKNLSIFFIENAPGSYVQKKWDSAS